MTLSPYQSITIFDLEVRNGFAFAAFLLARNIGSSVSLTRVVLRNMHSTSGSALDTYYCHASLSNVTFVNITNASPTHPSIIEANEPVDWTLENLRFIDFFFSESSSLLMINAASYNADVTFRGDMDFTSQPESGSVGCLVYFVSTSGNLTVLSSELNPVRWSFNNISQTPFFFSSQTGTISFAAASVKVKSRAEVSATPSPHYAFLVGGFPGTSYNFFITDALEVDGMGVISTITGVAATQFWATTVKLVSTRCRSNAVFSPSSPLFVHFRDVVIKNPEYQGLVLQPTLTMTVLTNLTLTRSKPSEYSAISTVPGSLPIMVGEILTVSNFFKTGNGSAIQVLYNSSMTVTAGRIDLIDNTASGDGGAIHISSLGSLVVRSNNGIIFRGNRATNGGAVALEDATAFLAQIGGSGPMPISFEYNQATKGGAVFMPPESVILFPSASYTGNQASEGCIIAYTDESCSNVRPTGNVSSNLLLVPEGTSSCIAAEQSCQFLTTSCPAIRPTVGEWTCANGAWVSNGSISGDSITISAGSHVVVSGNMTVGEVLISGLESSLSIEGGCASIGSIQITLSEEDLETISKDSGSARTLTLVTQNASCASLQALGVTASSSKKSCRKLESSRALEEMNGSQTSLVAVFKVSSVGCNTKWIILGSVLGGVLLLVTIAVLVVSLNKSVRTFFRPFSARKDMNSSDNVAPTR
jgi:hypothetical protein